MKRIVAGLLVFICFSCVKTEILNNMNNARKAKIDTMRTKQPRPFPAKDTTDTAKHEITFGPTIIGWEVVDVEVLPQEEVE